MNVVQCTQERHAQAILEIFNDAIANSTSLYEYRPRTPEHVDNWFAVKASGRFPIIGVESESGELLGFASLGTFRPYAGYKYTVEHSLYVHRNSRGQGIGKLLLGQLITAAEQLNVHVMVGGIDSANQASIRLHESLGFQHAGTIRQAGFKFGNWLDLTFYQKILSTPVDPVDG